MLHVKWGGNVGRRDRIDTAFDTLVDLNAPAPAWMGAVVDACDAEVGTAYHGDRDGHVDVFAAVAVDSDRLKTVLEGWYAAGHDFGWNPRHPRPTSGVNEPILTLTQIKRAVPGATVEAYEHGVSGPLGISLAKNDQLRAVLYQGDEALGWFGVVRPKRFTERQARAMRALLPAIRARMLYERRARTLELRALAFDALVSRTTDPVVVLDDTGQVHHASSPACVLLDRLTREDLAMRLAAARVVGSAGSFACVPVRGDGRPKALLFLDAPPTPLQQRARDWRLTPRETEVAEQLCRGLSNKEIALRLRLAPGTVAIHVGHVLDKAGVDSRTRFAALLNGRCS